MKRVKQFSIWIIALIGLMIANHPAWAKDTTPPTPGGYQSGYPKAVGMTTIEVKWKRATDNVTAQADLRYRVSWQKTSGGSWQTSHSEPFTNFPKDMTAYTITGLEPNTEYVVNVRVVDEAGNSRWYDERTVKTGIPDNTKPKPGGWVWGYPKALGMNTIEVKWKRATDDQTAQADLRYVVRWKRPWLTIWETSHPEPFTNYPKDMTSYTFSGSPGTEYVVDVGVYDKYGNYQWYGEKTVKTADFDTSPPTPGSYQSGYPKAVGTTSIELKWTRATDDQTGQAKLRYVVRWKKKSESSWQYSHSEPFTNYPQDMTSYTITGLEPNTKYEVNVEVFDEAGNGKNYGQQTVTIGTPDNTKPTSGGYQSGYPKATGSKTIELKWTRGSDNVTAPANLRYVVLWKKTSEITWQYSHSGDYTNWPKDWTAYTIENLEPNTKYFVAVKVYDEAGNGKSYGEKTVKTQAGGAADNTPPTPGGYQSGYPKAVGPTTIEVKWTRATDNVTATADLRYGVRWKKKSESSWQTSHPWPYTNFPKDITAYTLTGLEPNTEYLVNVVVVDEAVNYQSYGERTVKTQAGGAADNTPPTPGSYTSITSTAYTITLNWTRATDNVTPQNKLRYRVIYETKANYDAGEQLYGTTSKTDITTETITDLEPDTEYFVKVSVRNEAGKFTDYGPRFIRTKPAADKTSPTPGSYQSGYPKATGPTTIEVKWTRGTDNVTAQADLRYQVFCSKAGSSFQLKSGKLKDTYSHTF
ncbi:fibronectin type III domain-containing protein, partial [Tannerella forsythia]